MKNVDKITVAYRQGASEYITVLNYQIGNHDVADIVFNGVNDGYFTFNIFYMNGSIETASIKNDLIDHFGFFENLPDEKDNLVL